MFESCSAELYRHSARSYIYAAAIGAQANHEFDAELLAVGCLLHDVGLTEPFGDPKRSFEHVSADVAADLVEKHEWELARRYTMHRAMVLHMAPSIPPGDVIEVKLMEAGIACDVTGSNRSTLTSAGHRKVLDVFPRPNFAREFVHDMQRQATLLPSCHAAILLDAGLAALTTAHQGWIDTMRNFDTLTTIGHVRRSR